MNPTTNPSACFFDDEGCVAPDLRPTLIEKGTLTGLLTTKKSSDNLKIPNLGTAASTYDGVLCLGFKRTCSWKSNIYCYYFWWGCNP